MAVDTTKAFAMETNIICNVGKLEDRLKQHPRSFNTIGKAQSNIKHKNSTKKFLKSFASEVDKCRRS